MDKDKQFQTIFFLCVPELKESVDTEPQMRAGFLTDGEASPRQTRPDSREPSPPSAGSELDGEGQMDIKTRTDRR